MVISAVLGMIIRVFLFRNIVFYEKLVYLVFLRKVINAIMMDYSLTFLI